MVRSRFSSERVLQHLDLRLNGGGARGKIGVVVMAAAFGIVFTGMVLYMAYVHGEMVQGRKVLP